MDINMPEKTGYEVSKEIQSIYKKDKRAAKLKRPSIIACSAFNGEEDKKKAVENGMVDFVTKPIMKNALDTIIGKYFYVDHPHNILPITASIIPSTS